MVFLDFVSPLCEVLLSSLFLNGPGMPRTYFQNRKGNTMSVSGMFLSNSTLLIQLVFYWFSIGEAREHN